MDANGTGSWPGSGAIIFALRSWLLRYLDALSGDRYETVIVTRSDHLYACQHPKRWPAPRLIYVPEGEGYGGVSDRHTVFSFSDRRRVLSVLDWLIEHDRARVSKIKEPESILRQYYEDAGLKVRSFGRVMFVVRRQEDTTRWAYGIGPNKCEGELYLKYEGELITTRSFCGNRSLCPLFPQFEHCYRRYCW